MPQPLSPIFVRAATSLVFSLLCFVASGTTLAQLNGAHGTDGDPATNGQNGQSAEITFGTERPEIAPWYFAIAEAGGHGGNGGNGIDGDDDSEDADGGNGGDGGAGGYALNIFSALPIVGNRHGFAHGGQGGSGGIGGLDATGARRMGGDGGNGGDATVISNTTTNFTKLLVLAGNGGNATGQGATAGNGGLTSAIAQIVSSPGQQSGTVGIQMFGGHGGVGFAGANAGNGASHDLNRLNLQINFPSENPFYSRHVSVHVQGGDGGLAEFGGIAGTAGEVKMNLVDLADQLGRDDSIFFNYGFSFQGGRGGNATLAGNGFAHGRDGGNVTVEGDGVFEHKFAGSVQFDLVGGQGGSAIGRMNRGSGGHGGSVDMSHVMINNDGSAGSTATIDLNLFGGQGGHAQGGGAAGNGGSVDSVDDFSIRTSIAGRGTVRAKGGDGGSSSLNGHGGNVNVVIENAVIESGIMNPFSRRHFILGNAIGGNAGKGITGGNTANGGDANVFAKQVSRIGSIVNATSSAGVGTNGRSGNATARAEAFSIGSPPPDSPFLEGGYLARANAVATFNDVSLEDRRPTHGTNANAIAIGAASSDAESSAFARADGGWGSVQAGSASALAMATNSGSGASKANAEATSFNNRLAQNNSTYSRAFSTSNSMATSTSNSQSRGHFNRSIAWSSIDAQSGTARSTVQSSTANWKHLAFVSTEARLESDSDSTSIIGSTADSMFRGGQFFNSGSREANTSLVLNPNDSFARPLVNGSIQADVFNSEADILGIGRFHGGNEAAAFDGTLHVQSILFVELEVQDYQADKLMTFGLFDFESTGSGFSLFDFDLRYNDKRIFSVVTDSLGQLNNIFDANNTFFLDPLNNQTSQASFRLEYSMRIEDPNDSFGFKFLFGNAEPVEIEAKPGNSIGSRFSSVPEPSSTIFAGLTLLALCSRRRRGQEKGSGAKNV